MRAASAGPSAALKDRAPRLAGWLGCARRLRIRDVVHSAGTEFDTLLPAG